MSKYIIGDIIEHSRSQINGHRISLQKFNNYAKFLEGQKHKIIDRHRKPMPRQSFTRHLFFKWLKQNAQIKHFYGTSETAVIKQLLLALMTYTTLILLKLEIEYRTTS